MIIVSNKEIDGVIFDMDGLMFDTESVYTLTWPWAAKLFGYNVTKDVVMGAIGLNAEDGCKHFQKNYGIDFPFYEIRKKRLDIAMNYILEHGLVIKKGLIELLDFLKNNNIKIAVATSSEHERADKYLELSNLTDTFDYVVCGDEVKNGKPNPDIFLTAAQHIHQNITNCIVLEDSFNGIRAAYNSGAIPIMVPDCKQPNEEIKKLYYKKFDDLHLVKTFLESNIK